MAKKRKKYITGEDKNVFKRRKRARSFDC